MRYKGLSRACLCALLCFSCLAAGCKEHSEAPISEASSASGASATYSSQTNSDGDRSESGWASSIAGTGDTSGSGSVGGSSGNTSQPAESSSAPHVHDRKLTETVAATCDKDGYNLFVCECGDEAKTVLKATGHNYTEKTVEPTCDKDGYTRYTCVNCGNQYDDSSNAQSAQGHSWGEWRVTKDATASADGEKQSTCSRCGKTRSEVIPKTGNAASSNSFVSEVVRLVNIERANNGLSALKENAVLDEYAQLRSKEIVSNFAHERPDGSSPLNYVMGLSGIRTAGENIAWGQPTPAAVVNAWMNSPGHRANILNSKFTMIGVGCYKSGNAYYWTQIFAG